MGVTEEQRKGRSSYHEEKWRRLGWRGRTWHHSSQSWPKLGLLKGSGERGEGNPPKLLLADKSSLTSLATGPLQHRRALRWPLSCESLGVVPSSHHFQPKDPADKLVGFAVLSALDAEAKRQTVALCLLPASAG